MPRATAKGDADGPTCLICSQDRAGHKRTCWGGTYVSREVQSAGNSQVSITRYQDFKRFRVFFCDRCVSRNVLRYCVPYVLGCVVLAAAFLYGIEFVEPSPRKKACIIVLIVCATLSVLGAVYNSVVPFVPRFLPSSYESMAIASVQWRLRKLGPQDSFFTDEDYQKTFGPVVSGSDRDYFARKFPAEAFVKPRQEVATPTITRCPNCGKATPYAPTCKHCDEPLP